jgi:outer membrane protein, heavy metal efflux system
VCMDSKRNRAAIELHLRALYLPFRSRLKPHRRQLVFALRALFLIGLVSIVAATGVATRAGFSEGAEAEMAILETKMIQGPSVADLLAYAYRTNPTVKAAREEWRAKVARYRVDTAYDDPEIMAEGMYMTRGLGRTANPEDWKVSLTQTIPFPGKLGKAGQVATAEARIGRLKLDATVRDVTVQIRESYQELLYMQEARRVADQNRDLLDQLRKAGETAYAQNRAALVDMMKAQSQSGQLLYDALLLEELERTEKTRLNSFLNRPPEALIGPLTQEPLPLVVYKLDEIYLLTDQNLEEVRMAQVGIEKAQSSLALARYEILPQFKLGASIGEEDRENMIGVLAGLTVPLWFGKNAGRLEQARAEVEVATAMKDAQVNESRAMVRDTYFRLQNSERLVRLYRDQLLPQAAKSMELAETWYRQKQGSFSDFIETEAVWYNFQLALARAKADYGKFLARLEKLAGRSLSQKQAIPNEAGSKEGSR